MRLRPLLALGATLVLLTAGCAPTPEPRPEPTASASAAPSPTPTPEPIVEPDAAFDVTCEDVAAEMAALVGPHEGDVAESLSLVSASSWYPGPAQFMFQRAGGIACSTGDESWNWSMTIVPGASAVTAGAAERNGYRGEESRCEGGYCVFEIVEGDVLLSAGVHDMALEDASDAARIEEGLRRLAATAASTRRDVEYVESDIVNVECARFLTAEELAAQLGSEVVIIDSFGGWGIPAEVYHVVNGSRICYYASGPDEYEAQGHLMITSLPAGAWAFRTMEGTPVAIEGADQAMMSTDAFGRPVLDLRIGLDWIRLAGYENGSGAPDLTPIAEQMVQNFTVGRPAPQ